MNFSKYLFLLLFTSALYANTVIVLNNTSFDIDENIGSESSSQQRILGNISIENKDNTVIDSFTLNNHTNIFEINNEGQLSVKANTNLNYETTQSYTLNIIASNESNTSNTAVVTINVLNKFDILPTLKNTILDDIAEQALTIGNIRILDIGDSSIKAFNLFGEDSNTFNIAVDGQITLKDGYTLDYNSKATYSFEVNAENEAGSSQNITVTINIKEKNLSLPILRDKTYQVVENAPSDTLVGQIDIQTPGDDAISSFTLNGTNKELFEIRESSIYTKSPIDYEKNNTIRLTVTAINSYGSSTPVTLTINVQDIMDTTATLENQTINYISSDKIPANYKIGSVNIKSSGDSSISSFNLVGTDQNLFEVKNNGEVYTSSSFVYDANKTNFIFDLTAITDAGDSNSVKLTINLTSDLPVVEKDKNYYETINTVDLTKDLRFYAYDSSNNIIFISYDVTSDQKMLVLTYLDLDGKVSLIKENQYFYKKQASDYVLYEDSNFLNEIKKFKLKLLTKDELDELLSNQNNDFITSSDDVAYELVELKDDKYTSKLVLSKDLKNKIYSSMSATPYIQKELANTWNYVSLVGFNNICDKSIQNDIDACDKNNTLNNIFGNENISYILKYDGIQWSYWDNKDKLNISYGLNKFNFISQNDGLLIKVKDSSSSVITLNLPFNESQTKTDSFNEVYANTWHLISLSKSLELEDLKTELENKFDGRTLSTILILRDDKWEVYSFDEDSTIDQNLKRIDSKINDYESFWIYVK